MKRSVRFARDICNLHPSFHQRLNRYALQATAAGVGLLAVAHPAEARVVYTHVNRVIGNGRSYNLDLNHDGVTDLTIRNKLFQSCSDNCWSSETLGAMLARDNQVVYNAFGAVAMKAGMRIGPRDAFRGGHESMARAGTSFSASNGSWVNVKNRYLGVKFEIKGKIHYGWVRLTVQVQPLQITARLTGYAYETIPNKPIIAGKTQGAGGRDGSAGQPEDALTESTPRPATLGLLASGSSGLSTWRREELAGFAQ